MNVTLNLDEIRDYNNRLKKAKNIYSQLESEISYIKNDLLARCAELTKELGVEVTIDNAMEVYEVESKKIAEQLKTGKEILNNIESQKIVS